MTSQGFARRHLCEGLLAAAAETDSDEGSARRAHAKAKMRLMSMSRKELRDLAELTSSFLDRPVKVSYQELKRTIAQHRENAGEWVNDLKIDWNPASGEKMPERILIIGGNPLLIKGLISALVRDGFSATHVSDYPQAMLKAHDFKPDLIIIDEVAESSNKSCFQLGDIFNVPIFALGKDHSGKAMLSALQPKNAPGHRGIKKSDIKTKVEAALQESASTSRLKCGKQGSVDNGFTT
jgi:hypothetical protein